MFISITTQKTGDVEPMMVYCWTSVCDAGPTLNHYWFIAGRLVFAVYKYTC